MRRLIALLVVASAVAAAAVAHGGASPPRSIVGCDTQIATAEEPLREAVVVLDRIALPRDRYPWPLARGADRRFRWWGKWGMAVRAGPGEAVAIGVARPWRRHARIGWGDGHGRDVAFMPCAADQPWVVYAGGFELKKLGCVPFDVRVGGRIERVRVGFGRPC